MRKRLRPHSTLTGRVVYNRKPHKFTEKDALRVVRSLLDDEIRNPGAWLATFLIQVVRTSITFYKDTQRSRLFLLSLIDDFLPKSINGILTLATKYTDEFFTTLYNHILSFIGGLKPSVTLDDLDDIGD